MSNGMNDPPASAERLPRPIKHCYWVRSGRLLAGEYPRNKDEASSPGKVAALRNAGVGVFIDLTEPRDELAPYGHWIGDAVRRRFPLRDGAVPESPSSITEILNAIDEDLARGTVVYVHCWGGIGRTGLIIGCWLARNGAGGEEGLRRLRDLWCHCPKSRYQQTPETEAQARCIRGKRCRRGQGRGAGIIPESPGGRN